MAALANPLDGTSLRMSSISSLPTSGSTRNTSCCSIMFTSGFASRCWNTTTCFSPSWYTIFSVHLPLVKVSHLPVNGRPRMARFRSVTYASTVIFARLMISVNNPGSELIIACPDADRNLGFITMFCVLNLAAGSRFRFAPVSYRSSTSMSPIVALIIESFGVGSRCSSTG